ncbi:MAG TPA: polysaccharide biosynthesis C-terminal domain-containing protein, partial [Defluviitaleaceae bacterium]|nr:polysaccharide biosynthesis C-terminal domain-containing protein [Defluviitaleaceae bacterium]
KLQDNIPKLKEAYLKVLQITTFLSFFVTGLIFILSPEFTALFLGEKWLPMVPAMQVLVFWGLIRSIGGTTGPIFQAVGKPKILTKCQLLQLFFLGALIYPLTTNWGITGTSLAVAISAFIGNLPAFYSVVKITKCGKSNFLKIIGFSLIVSITAIAAVFLLKTFLSSSLSLLTLFILYLITYGTIYLFSSWFFDKFSPYKIKDLAREVFFIKG